MAPQGPSRGTQAPKETVDKASTSKTVKASGKGRGRRLKLTVDIQTTPGQPPFDCHTNEPKCAAYLGYDDISTFRIFRFSAPVLYALWRYNHSKAKPKKGHYKAAMELLSEVPLSEFRSDDGYTDEESSWQLASIIIGLYEDIKKTETQDITQRTLQFQKSRDLFNKEVLLPKAKDMELPYINMDSLVFPRLEPRTELNEHETEKWARCYNLLMSLDHVIAPSRFKNAYMIASNPFTPTRLHPSALPSWMRDGAPKANSLLKKSTVPSSKILMRFEFDEFDESHKDIQSLINESFPKETAKEGPGKYYRDTCPIPRDPSVYPTGTMWRDALRRDLAFPKLALDFKVIKVDLSDGLSGSISVWGQLWHEQYYDDCKTWTEFKSLLETHVDLMITFELLTVHTTPEDYIFEYDGPPLAIAEDITMDKYGDPCLVHPDLTKKSAAISETNEQDLEDLQKLLDAGGGTISRSRPPAPTERFKLPEEERSFLKYYNGYDLRTAKGLLDFQRATLDLCIGGPRRANIESLTGNRKIDRETVQGVRISQAKIQKEILKTDSRHFQVEAAFQGTNIYTGPRVDHCKTLMNMTHSGQLSKIAEYKLSKCRDIPACDAEFLDSQINGAAWMLSRTFGMIPIAPERLAIDNAETQDLKSIQAEHLALKINGGILGDSTGMGKTMTACLYLSYQAQYGMNLHTPTKTDGSDYKSIHRPSIVLCPSSNVLMQWAELISMKFKNLTLIIGFGDAPPKQKYALRWIKGTAMREYQTGNPSKLKLWPINLRWIFDQNNDKASSVVILSTYDTLSERIVETSWKMSEDDPPIKKKVFRNRWEGSVDTVIMDEGHKCRHTGTRIVAMVKSFKARLHWFLTATPIVNSVLDILGLLDIMWHGLFPDLRHRQDVLDWMNDNVGWQGFEKCVDFSVTDMRRIMFLHPKRVQSLLQTTDITAVAKWFPLIDGILILRRSPSSEIDLGHGNTLSLHGLMPSYEVRTTLLEYREEEKAEAAWMHRAHAREYVKAVKSSMRSREMECQFDSAAKHSFPPTIQHLRRLCICSASTLLGRFDLFLRRHNLNTLVSNMDKWRQKGGNLDWFLSIVHRPGDPPINTHAQKLQFLCSGSPKARALCIQIRDYLLPQVPGQPGEKILFAEDTVPVAWFWELLFTGFFIDTGVLHAQLNHQERIDMVNSFNDKKSSLVALISMFGVSTQGTNFHAACHRVCVITPALNAPNEIQIWGRAIRIGQEHRVLVLRYKVLNSHDQYRDSKQVDKAFMELATRCMDPQIQNLLVVLLNEANWEVAQAHKEQERKTREGIQPSVHIAFDDDSGAVVAADVEEEDPVIDSHMTYEENLNTLRRSKRPRTKPERLDTQYLNSDIYILEDDTGNLTEAGPSTKKARISAKGKGVSTEWYRDDYHLDTTDDDEDIASSTSNSYRNKKGKSKAIDIETTSLSRSLENLSSDDTGIDDYDPEDNVSDDDNESDQSYILSEGELDEEKEEDEENDASQTIIPFAEMTLDNHTVRDLRKKYWAVDNKEMEAFDQDDLNERNLLRFEVDKRYTVEDLQVPAVLDRAIRLLFQARFGQQAAYWRISPHINYDVLPDRITKAIDQRLTLDRVEMEKMRWELNKRVTAAL